VIEPLLRRALDLKSRGASQTAFIILANVCGRMSVKENQLRLRARDPRRRECLNDQQIVLRSSSPASFRVVCDRRLQRNVGAMSRVFIAPNEPEVVHSSFSDMTRLLLRGIDFGASAVFMALCAKAFCVHFYKDAERELKRRRSSPSPLPIPPDATAIRQPPALWVQSKSRHLHQP
jgi:hypothetical protein